MICSALAASFYFFLLASAQRVIVITTSLAAFARSLAFCASVGEAMLSLSLELVVRSCQVLVKSEPVRGICVGICRPLIPLTRHLA